ncbi:glycosyltransferase [Elizabethkingia argentiflava]|uniref:Glycosyltransferase n=2 Tax=Elizabethkingia argenteiflava TaxID=2681556 RepID=A0A845PSW1_9FLAO|nr:glycosyltransferase [Elizabethkingia argenteiflava]
MLQKSPLVSIIVPIYNAEKTLHTTLDSIVGQTYPFIELLLINDCSQDNTLSICHQYARVLEQQERRVEIVSHPQNRGVAAARNTGLEHATGVYVYYVDADDWVEENTIEILVNEMLRTGADLVGCNWFLSLQQNERKMHQPSFGEPSDAIKKMLNGSMRWNLWLFMVRRALYQQYNIRFEPGLNMGEDMMVMFKLLANAKRVSYIDYALYHYSRSNTSSMTQVYSTTHIQQVTENLKIVEKYLENSNFSNEIKEGINFLKLNIKLPLLISDRESDYQQWLQWFPEAHAFIMGNKALPWRIRILQWMAVKKQFWILKLYYHILIRYIC